MQLNNTPVSIDEQIRNVRFVMSIAHQPLVSTLLDQLAEQRHRSSLKEAVPSDAASVRPPKGITEAADQILPLLDRDFTYVEFAERLIAHGYTFKAKDRRAAVGGVLRELRSKGMISVVRRGAGGKPSTYKVIR